MPKLITSSAGLVGRPPRIEGSGTAIAEGVQQLAGVLQDSVVRIEERKARDYTNTEINRISLASIKFRADNPNASAEDVQGFIDSEADFSRDNSPSGIATRAFDTNFDNLKTRVVGRAIEDDAIRSMKNHVESINQNTEDAINRVISDPSEYESSLDLVRGMISFSDLSEASKQSSLKDAESRLASARLGAMISSGQAEKALNEIQSGDFDNTLNNKERTLLEASAEKEIGKLKTLKASAMLNEKYGDNLIAQAQEASTTSFAKENSLTFQQAQQIAASKRAEFNFERQRILDLEADGRDGESVAIADAIIAKDFSLAESLIAGSDFFDGQQKLMFAEKLRQGQVATDPRMRRQVAADIDNGVITEEWQIRAASGLSIGKGGDEEAMITRLRAHKSNAGRVNYFTSAMKIYDETAKRDSDLRDAAMRARYEQAIEHFITKEKINNFDPRVLDEAERLSNIVPGSGWFGFTDFRGKRGIEQFSEQNTEDRELAAKGFTSEEIDEAKAALVAGGKNTSVENIEFLIAQKRNR